MLARVPPASRTFIAMPAYTGAIEPETRRSLESCAPLCLQKRIAIIDCYVLSGCCYLDHARNICVKKFLESDASDLLFVDTDVGFGPDAIARILTTTKPFVAGIYPKKEVIPDWPVTLLPGDQRSDAEGCLRVAMVPTGFLRLHRSVFETLADKVPTYRNAQHGDLKAFFKTEIRDGEYWGEDVEFCRLWREAGGEIHAIPDMDFKHIDNTGKVFEGNWGRWLRENLAQRAA